MAKKTALLGMLVALAFVLSYIETLIPVNLGIPGAKLGLANLVTIIALIRLGIGYAVIISVGRIVLSGILFGNPLVIVYSLAGAFLSMGIMWLVRKLHFFTVTGVSICGAIAHNAGQLIVATIAMENASILYYMVVLSVTGLVAGLAIGLLASYLLKNIRF